MAAVAFIAFLAVVISCLGLLGMAIYTSERKAKEVGIRKVLGATVSQFTLTLGRAFFFVLLIAIGLAAPASYFIYNLWL